MSLSELSPSHTFLHVTLSPPQGLSKMWLWRSLYPKGEGRLVCKLRQYDNILIRKERQYYGKVEMEGAWEGFPGVGRETKS